MSNALAALGGMVEFAIHSAGMTKRYGKRAAVDGLGLQVCPGRVTGFLGPNGAGKTTAISLLLGLLKLDSGDCEVLGLPPGDPRALRHIGALVESPSLYEHLTGAENLEITRLLRGLPKSAIDRALRLVGLEKDAKRPVRAYSLGMKQRLGVALALMGEPSLLILDEPLNGLDPSGILEMRELIRGLANKGGATVFLSSHILAEVEQVASELVVMHKGRLRYQGPMEGLAGGDPPLVSIKTDDPSKAAEALANLGFKATAEPGRVLLEVRHEDVPRANCALVASGLAVYEIAPLQKNLESRFLSLLEDA
jgi:ABC-2 type transport system ATP-binding protein